MAGSIQRMLQDRKRTNDVLTQIEGRVTTMNVAVIDNTQRAFKENVPPLVNEVSLLRAELYRVETEKERIVELLIKVKEGLTAQAGNPRLEGDIRPEKNRGRLGSTASSKRDRDDEEEDNDEGTPSQSNKQRTKKKRTGKTPAVSIPHKTTTQATTSQAATAQPSKSTEVRAQARPSEDASTRTNKKKTNEKEQQVKSRSTYRRNDSIKVTVTKGDYASVLKALKKKIDVSNMETEIRGMKESKKGDIVIQLGPEKSDREAFIAKLQSAAPNSKVELMRTKTWIQIRDMDEDTTEEEVKAALKGKIGEEANDCKVMLTRPNWRKQRTAIVEATEVSATKLLQEGKVRIGWIVCRIYKKTLITRCYKCLGYGHFKDQCNGPDRSNCCYRCGKPDHKAAACRDEPECVLCKEKGIGDSDLKHIPGTAACKAFLDARAREMKKNNRRRR